jgi:thiamine pyrophosphate-dependent acetolactate synthase large subunit-like protein
MVFLSRFRASWHHPTVQFEPSSAKSPFPVDSEIVDNFAAGPDALLEAIERRLRRGDKATAASPDPRPREYVERSFAERQARFHEIIESLRQAFDDDDMVTAYSEWVTLRRLLNELRFAANEFGALHDAVAFTSIERLCLPMVDAVARAFALACMELE